jgi:ElaB/YqjD/DUF883 family membrane-anchored ribosome-binding protein
MNDRRTPEEIERQLEREREGLADSLEDLKDKFSVDTIVREAANQIREHSGDIGASVTRAVKENPLGVALTGVGLAWLIFGERRSPQSDWEGDRYRSSSVRQRQMRGISDNTVRSMRDDDAPAWTRYVDETHDDAGDSTTSGSVMDKVHDTAEAMRDRAASLRTRLSEGTEHLSEEGRARVIAAREKAYEAREAAMSRMTDAKDKAVDLFEEQPLIAGALALAVGAAIGAALPHTRFEDEHFGETSDELVREAERIFSEERAKLASVAQESVKQAGEIVEKAGSSLASAAGADADDSDTQTGHGKRESDAAGTDTTLQTGGRKPLQGDIPS